jgi:hypothetical protein
MSDGAVPARQDAVAHWVSNLQQQQQQQQACQATAAAAAEAASLPGSNQAGSSDCAGMSGTSVVASVQELAEGNTGSVCFFPKEGNFVDFL